MCRFVVEGYPWLLLHQPICEDWIPLVPLDHQELEVHLLALCLLQKIKRTRDLPVIEKCEAYMLSLHSSFRVIAEDQFLEGIRLFWSLAKISSSFFRKEIRRDCRRFLEAFASIILSTLDDRPLVEQGLSCFYAFIVIGGDDHSAFYLFRQRLDGLLEIGWLRGSDNEAAKVEFHSFVREQRRVEGAPADYVPQSATCLLFVTSVVFALGTIGTKLVSGGVSNFLNLLCTSAVFRSSNWQH